MKLYLKSNYTNQKCAECLGSKKAVIRAVGKHSGRALCIGCLHKLSDSGWETAAITKDISVEAQNFVLEYVKGLYPGCVKPVAPTQVGCNNIRYDAEGLLAEGYRVTEAELEAMLAKVRELKAAGVGKQRVWWSCKYIGDGGYNKKGKVYKGWKYDTLAERLNGLNKYSWEPCPVDADGNEVKVRWRAKRKSDGVWCAEGSVYKTQKEHLQVINSYNWDSVPVLASNKGIELDLRLGGATWEPAT